MQEPRHKYLVVLSGASTGIGRATAVTLADRGHLVLAGCRSEAAREDLRTVLRDRGQPVRLDVTVKDDVDALAELVEARLRPDLRLAVVSNAGIATAGPIEALTDDDLRRQLEVNVVGAMRLVRSLLPAVRRSRGRIVCVSSLSGYLSTPLLGAYTASKFALEALCDALRQEMAPFGVRVSLVEPGVVQTPIWEKSVHDLLERLTRAPADVKAIYEKNLALIEPTLARSRSGIEPRVVADAIAAALAAARPKARYRVGVDAKVAAILKRALPDTVLDHLIRHSLGTPGNVVAPT